MKNPCLALTLIASAASLASVAHAAADPALTLDASAQRSSLTNNLPDGRAAELRATWQRNPAQVLRASALDERKLGLSGGAVGGGITQELSPEWIFSADAAAGHGGVHWARNRVDLELSRKWLAGGALVTRLGVFRAGFAGGRRDEGLRVAAVGYLPGSLVLEGGATVNRSQPGGVRSTMPYAALTWGQERDQYLSLRVSDGREAWQATGTGAQLVDFHSSSVGLSWRRWVAPGWGFTLSAEQYRNPAYERRSVGVGLFGQY